MVANISRSSEYHMTVKWPNHISLLIDFICSFPYRKGCNYFQTALLFTQSEARTFQIWRITLSLALATIIQKWLLLSQLSSLIPWTTFHRLVSDLAPTVMGFVASKSDTIQLAYLRRGYSVFHKQVSCSFNFWKQNPERATICWQQELVAIICPAW